MKNALPTFSIYMEIIEEQSQAGSAIARHVPRQKKIGTIGEFLEIIKPLFTREREKKELAKVFQALRIQVNREMEALKEMLIRSHGSIKAGGKASGNHLSFAGRPHGEKHHQTGNIEGKAEKDFFGNVQTPFRLVNNKVIVPDNDGDRTQPALAKRQAEDCGKSVRMREAIRL